MVLEDILDTNVYQAPEPFMNPKLCIQIAQSKYLRAKTKKVEEEKLELLRRFLEDSAALIKASQPTPDMQGGMMGGTRLGTPETAPESDLIPFKTPVRRR
jgi:hypothetical protein